EADLDAVEDFHVLAETLKNVFGQHVPQAKTKPMIQAERRAVKHHPEPDQGLALGVARGVDVAIVLRLESGVPRIESMDHRLHSQLRRPRVRAAVWASEIDLVQGIAHYFA